MMFRGPLGALSSPSIKDEVKERIREEIISGNRKPGERIVETEVARSLGISQVPVREALCGLEEEGLVRSVKYKGTFVADLIPSEVFHVFQLRVQVEMTALELVIPVLTRAQIEELRSIVEEMRRYSDNPDYMSRSKLDVKFHSRIIEWAEVELYQRVWRMLYGHVGRFISLVHPTFYLQNHASEHEILVNALENGDVARAKELFSKHIMLLWRQEGQRWLKGNTFMIGLDTPMD